SITPHILTYHLFPYTTLFRSGIRVKSNPRYWCIHERTHAVWRLRTSEKRLRCVFAQGRNEEARLQESPLSVPRRDRSDDAAPRLDRKSTRLNSSHQISSYAVF